ncbi:unnamed protein product [Somion occarium]|uniref:Ras GEF n=1 Tax=Somion occarium TaxID=3059160 RepID=A0ABP1CUA4_9APHY
MEDLNDHVAKSTKNAPDEVPDSSHISTPTASIAVISSAPVASSSKDTSICYKATEAMDEFSASLASMMDSRLSLSDSDPSDPQKASIAAETNNGQFLLPLPTPSVNRSRTSFSLQDTEDRLVSLDSLPPEVASADISIATDGSFVETSSGAAARELKRRYDQLLGVGKDVRSPYVITAIVNQYGKQMYRVGHRDLTTPHVADDVNVPSTRAKSTSFSTTASAHPHHASHTSKRRSRMSVHSFLPPVVFKNGSAPSSHAPKPHVEDGSRSPPTRKLRKTRSIPNMSGAEAPKPPPEKPSTPTGRPHAHSVSSADAYRGPLPPPPATPHIPKTPYHDAFSEALWWDCDPPSPYGSRSARSSSRPPHDPANESSPGGVHNPFGPGVTFDSPAWPSTSCLTSPPVLREMQSFDSGLTARADPQPRGSRFGKLRTRQSDELFPQMDSPSPGPSPIQPEPPQFTAPSEFSMVSRYSTELFDILQNSRGLPSLDKISPNSNEKTIRLSLKADETAAPRDDPRFVIWGELEADEVDSRSVSRGSITEFSSGRSGVSRRKSGKRHTVAIPDTPVVRVPSNESPRKVLIAATIERWIAQLTSELNYDELLIFFLTYRTYISAVDLGHLLICRFHWALAQPTSPHDEMVRRIVRVRTFIAIRYWLLTFFSVDFMPNRELRLLFADWLNSLKKDPVLTRHKDAVSIVRKLRKVVLDCKDAHTRKQRVDGRSSTDKSKVNPNPVLGDLSNGHFAESLRKAVSKEEDEEPDIDLDFDGAGSTDPQDFRLGAAPSKNPTTAVDLAMLRQPLHLVFLQHNKQATPTSPVSPPVLGPGPLPVTHSTLSRVLVSTMGRLGRWKRVLHSRSPVRAPMGTSLDVSAFDVEASESGDLLQVKGGVEQYLKMVEDQIAQASALLRQPTPVPPPPPPVLPPDVPQVPPAVEMIPDLAQPSDSDTSDGMVEELEPVTEASEEDAGARPPPKDGTPDALDTPELSRTDTSLDSSVQSDFLTSDESVSSSLVRHPLGLDVDIISIDDLSDLSSDEQVDPSRPPGLKKPLRRLPNRRDFEFVRHSVDSVSSMGIQSRDSVLSAGSSSVISSVGEELGSTIQQWQVTALVDSLSDEEEEGNVEAALRRLEGQISQDKQRAKKSKVDGWVQSMRERLAAGQFGTARSRDSSDEEDYGEVQTSLDRPSSPNSVSQRSAYASRRSSVSYIGSPLSHTAPALDTATHNNVPHPHVVAGPDAKPAVEDAVPMEILQSRVPSRPGTSAGSPPTRHTNGLSITQPPSKFISEKHRWHRSFVTEFSSELLIQHFSMIDRELFLSLKFEELVAQDWMAPSEDTNILDWAEFLRERARLRAEGRIGQKTTALTLVRGRFNLVANFVQSEIVLTHPSQRATVYGKFVRMAWKSYLLMNFNMLVAIIAGLRGEWVRKAMKQGPNRLGIWETRMLQDLIVWTTSEGHFKHIRHTVDALAEAKTISGYQDCSNSSTDGQSSSRSRATSDGKPPPPSACVPFLGIYLSYLRQYNALPDLIDPTAPNEPVAINSITNTFESPAHPEVFSSLAPLPPSVQLEPLINVHKQRLIADVIKSLTAGQHLASRVQFALDKKLFQKCLKLRGLDSDTLQRALALYPERP